MKIECPRCGKKDIKVLETYTDGHTVWKECQCKDCDREFQFISDAVYEPETEYVI